MEGADVTSAEKPVINEQNRFRSVALSVQLHIMCLLNLQNTKQIKTGP